MLTGWVTHTKNSLHPLHARKSTNILLEKDAQHLLEQAVKEDEEKHDRSKHDSVRHVCNTERTQTQCSTPKIQSCTQQNLIKHQPHAGSVQLLVEWIKMLPLLLMSYEGGRVIAYKLLPRSKILPNKANSISCGCTWRLTQYPIPSSLKSSSFWPSEGIPVR